MHNIFGPLFEKYGKSIDTFKVLNIEDFEFRKKYIIKQHDIHFRK